MKYTIGHWNLALGIDWLMPSSAREARDAKKQRAKQMYAQTARAGQRWLGFHEPMASKKLYAAAMLVGIAKPNAVVFAPLGAGAGQAWVCSIYQGMPVVGYDVVEPIEQARRTALEWSSVFPESELTGEVGNGLALESILQTLDDGLRARAIQKRDLRAAHMHARGVPVALLAKVSAVAAAVAGSYYAVHAYSDWQVHSKQSAAAAMSAARDAALYAGRHQAATAEHQQQLRTFEQQLAHERGRIRTGVSPAAFWSAFTALRQSLPLSQASYRPISIDCSVQTCRVSWQAQGAFASPVDRFSLPGVKPTLDTGLSADSEFPLSLPDAVIKPAPAGSLDVLRFGLKTQFAARRFTLDLGEPHAVTVQPPKALSVPPVTIGQVGSWHVTLASKTALLDAPLLLEYVASQPMRLTSIRYQGAASSPTIQIEGEYIYLTETEASRGL